MRDSEETSVWARDGDDARTHTLETERQRKEEEGRKGGRDGGREEGREEEEEEEKEE